MIVLVIDPHVEDVIGEIRALAEELSAYGHGLPDKETVVVLNKVDLGEPSEELVQLVRGLGMGPVLLTSGVSGSGLKQLKSMLMERVEEMRDADVSLSDSLRMEKEEDGWRP